MIDIKTIREEPDRIRAELAARNIDIPFDRLVKLDAERRGYQSEIDELRARQNAANQAIADAAGPKKAEKIAAMKEIASKIKQLDVEKEGTEHQFRQLYLALPNFHHETTPVGKDETENKVVKEVGKRRIPGQAGNDDRGTGNDDGAIRGEGRVSRDDGTGRRVLASKTRQGRQSGIKPHYDIPAIKPLIDFERGAKVSGSRFWYLKGELVELEFALLRYTIDFYKKKGYLPMRPPSIVKHAAMEGTGFFPADLNEIYELEDDEGADEGTKKYLAGTAEVPLASYHGNETLRADDLPVKYLGFSPAYRREAGTYGKDTKGILRGHEFDKMELFVFAHPETSWELHEQLQQDAEEYWTALGIPFQVVLMCTGDIGAPNAKKYDLEAWMPGEGKYREVASNSHDTDFQARRLGIRYGSGEKSEGLVHTLNNTACAVGRTIIAITENYQDESGNVDMPKVLQPYLDFSRIIKE